MMKYDVAVVGAGPVGSIAAQRASKGRDVVIFGGERVVQCSGVLSTTGLQELNINTGDYVLNKVRGAKIISPSGVQAVIDGGGDKACVVDRLKFDDHLLDRAVDSGATYIPAVVDEIKDVLKTSDGREFAADKIIMATGTNYTLQKKLCLDCPDDFLIGAQYEMNVECDKDFVELHLTVPDFFAWVIPLDGYARVGLCAKQNPKKHLDNFVARLKNAGRIKSDKKLSEIYGIIPLYKPSIRTQYDRIVTVGDAAGHVKASTGGGIIFGGLAAELACSPTYERDWRGRIGAELSMHLMFHNLLKRLKPKNLDRLVRLVGSNHSGLVDGGDMDYAIKTFKNLSLNPKFALEFIINAPFMLPDLI